jgi:hypothetical protein
MTTERELDLQLQVARGLREEELPALSEEFLDFLHASRGAGASTPASLLAARQLVADAHDRRTLGAVRGRRRPRRRTVVRAASAVLAVAAAATVAVLVTSPHADRSAVPASGTSLGRTQPRPVDPPPNGIALVAAEQVTFPLSLDPAPQGLTPSFSRFGGHTPFGDEPVGYSADYRAQDGDGFQLWITPQDPREMVDGPQPHNAERYSVTEQRTVDVDGAGAELVRGGYAGRHCTSAPSTPQQTRAPGEVCTSTFAYLAWQRSDGQWVWIWADDTYSTVAAVVGIAESLIDRPQPAGLQLGLAPAGWSVTSYEDSGMSLASDADPDQLISLSVLQRWRGYRSVDAVLDEVQLTGPVEEVTVQGKPARVALGKGDPWPHDWWNISAELPDGTLFLLQVSNTLSQEQALQIAEQVTYTP